MLVMQRGNVDDGKQKNTQEGRRGGKGGPEVRVECIEDDCIVTKSKKSETEYSIRLIPSRKSYLYTINQRIIL